MMTNYRISLIEWPDSQACIGCEHAIIAVELSGAVFCLAGSYPDGYDSCSTKVVARDNEEVENESS